MLLDILEGFAFNNSAGKEDIRYLHTFNLLLFNRVY